MKNLGMGLGLRAKHYKEILADNSGEISWFEALTENYLDLPNGLFNPSQGRPLDWLLQVRDRFKIVLHGVSLSIGGTDPLCKDYLKRLQSLIEIIEPEWVSDHLCWTGIDNKVGHDLFPLPYHSSTLRHVAARINRVQTLLKRPILIENVSSYLSYQISDWSEYDFLAELSKRTGCYLLCDINNIYVNSKNHGFDPTDFLKALDPKSVAQIHLAGHSTRDIKNGTQFLIDTHDSPVAPEVWSLYEKSVELFGTKSTMVEWDANIPSYSRLKQEIFCAKIFQSQRPSKKNLLSGSLGKKPEGPKPFFNPI